MQIVNNALWHGSPQWNAVISALGWVPYPLESERKKPSQTPKPPSEVHCAIRLFVLVP